MKQCPKCGSYMSWDIVYICGVPHIIWKCLCGYDSDMQSYTLSNNTNWR